jgi:hypothetical protein
MAAFFVKRIQPHPEDDYIMVVEDEVIHLVITTTKAQARVHDPMTLERPFSWTYSIFKEFKTRVESRKTTRKYS